MALTEISLRQWIDNFDAGCYSGSDVATQTTAGWYDWFCSDSNLKRKTVKLGKLVKQLSKSPKIDQDRMFVWFKNNCPLNGKLYDVIHFSSLDSGQNFYTVIPYNGHQAHLGLAEVWGRENSFEEPLQSGKWKNVLLFFGV